MVPGDAGPWLRRLLQGRVGPAFHPTTLASAMVTISDCYPPPHVPTISDQFGRRLYGLPLQDSSFASYYASSFILLLYLSPPSLDGLWVKTTGGVFAPSTGMATLLHGYMNVPRFLQTLQEARSLLLADGCSAKDVAGGLDFQEMRVLALIFFPHDGFACQRVIC